MNIFITGGNTGIGLEVGILFANNGAKVGVCSFLTVDQAGELPKGFSYFQADVTNYAQLQKAIDDFVAQNGKIDIIYANAGLNMPKTALPDTKLGEKLTYVNVLGVVNAFNASLPYFLKQKSGHFVAISSISGVNGLPGLSYYGASKAFVRHFCESLALDLNSYNIDITCLVPGFIDTNFTKNNKNPMPFLLTKEKAANIIYQSITKKKKYVAFPFVPYAMMKIFQIMPKFLYYFIMEKDPFKMRYKD